jgi:hypothetical protein
MLHRVALIRTDVSEELSASFIRVTRISELGTNNDKKLLWNNYPNCNTALINTFTCITLPHRVGLYGGSPECPPLWFLHHGSLFLDLSFGPMPTHEDFHVLLQS